MALEGSGTRSLGAWKAKNASYLVIFCVFLEKKTNQTFSCFCKFPFKQGFGHRQSHHILGGISGNALSQFCCASLLSRDGERARLGEAEEWLRRSAKQGFGPAKQVSRLQRDGLLLVGRCLRGLVDGVVPSFL